MGSTKSTATETQRTIVTGTKVFMTSIGRWGLLRADDRRYRRGRSPESDKRHKIRREEACQPLHLL
ncbi:MAG: hypothetical protein QF408_05320 [Pirellulales bacterium]|nr:hypothetical protein [Pirellulales bacterium]